MSIALACMVLLGQTPGVTQSFDRTAHFISSSAGIDFENDDRFEFTFENSAPDRNLWLRVSKLQTGTRLPEGVFVPSPPGGKPEEWKLPISKDGAIAPGGKPTDPFERVLIQIVVAAWRGAAPDDKAALISVKAAGPNRESLAYDGSAIQDPAKFKGTAELDPESHVPISISLTGENVEMPGGSDRETVKVEYRRPSKDGNERSAAVPHFRLRL